jgi:uncharacterized protein (TIGR02996 family)
MGDPFPEGSSEARALLDGVLDNPEEDTPRLIYADWLDDHGQAERADFIRLQLRLARLAPDDPARPALEAQQRRLRKKHERHWVGPLRAHLHGWHFVRGFVEYLALDASTLLEQSSALSRTYPVRSLHLHGARAVLPRLASCLLLARLHTLDLSGNFLDAGACDELLRGGLLGGLRVLRINDNPFGYDAVRAVAVADDLTGLEALELRRNNLTEATVVPLAESPFLAGLRALDLRGNAIGEPTRSQLRALFPGAALRF